MAVTAPAAAAPPRTAIPDLEAAPKEGETLCLATQPQRIAALIAQKRAANEANRKREAWTRRAAAHRMSSQAPDDQLRSELNSAVGRPATSHPPNLVPGEDQAQRHAEQYVTPTAAITFNPAVPPAAAQADTRTTDHASHSNPKPRSSQKGARPAEPINKNTSHNNDSLLPPAASQPPTTAEPPKPGGAPGMQSIQLATNQDSPSEAQQPSVAAISNDTAPPGTAQSPFNDTSANPDKSKGRQVDPSLTHRSALSNHTTQVAAGYYRFNPRHWQTSSPDQQQPLSQPSPATTPSEPQRVEATPRPASDDRQLRTPSSQVFRNLTQDKFGSFGVGGKLKEAVTPKPSGSAT